MEAATISGGFTHLLDGNNFLNKYRLTVETFPAGLTGNSPYRLRELSSKDYTSCRMCHPDRTQVREDTFAECGRELKENKVRIKV